MYLVSSKKNEPVPGYCPAPAADTFQPNPHITNIEIIELCSLCTIWKYYIIKILFLKTWLIAMLLLCCITYYFLIYSYLLMPLAWPVIFVFSSARLSEPITAMPIFPLLFWFVEVSQSLLRSFLFPVESLAGSGKCKMIGYSSSHENIMANLLE